MINKKILIVEDEESLLKLLSESFIENGIDVLGAVDGEQGLKMALEEHPDLILLDIILPKMDGITMLKKLREDERGKDVKVIILSNLSDSERVEEAMQKGVYDYLIKSNWNLADVINKVKEKLNL